MSEKFPVIVIGSGGHAKVVVSTLLRAGRVVQYVLDDRKERWGATVLDVPIIGPISRVSDFHNAEAIIAIGGNKVRRTLQQELNVSWATVVHPSAYVDSSAELGEGTVVFAGAVIQPGVWIGRHVIVNTAASIDHDCVVGDYAQIAPGAHIGGNVTVGEGSFVGIGAVAIQCLNIGVWSTVGAGAAIVRNVPDHATVVGVPGKVITSKDQTNIGIADDKSVTS